MSYFQDAHQAMQWASEVLRQSQFPSISAFYREITTEKETDKSEFNNTQSEGQVQQLAPENQPPTTRDEQMALALSVYRQLGRLELREAQLLKMHYWGDYYDAQALAKAQKAQESLRRQGIRVRLNYRYSFRQLGAMLGKDHKTIATRIRNSQQNLHQLLQEVHLVPAAPATREVAGVSTQKSSNLNPF